MKIALIGASGFVGTVLVNEFLNRGHQVTAIARNLDQISEHSNLTVVKADVTDKAGLTEAIKGNDAVVSAFNAGWTNPNLYQDFLEGAKTIQAAVKAAGVKRFLFIGGAGSLYGPDGTQLVDGPHFPEAYKAGATSARDYLNVLKEEQDLDWTFLSPAIEMNQGAPRERKGTYRTSLETPVFNAEGRSQISVDDLSVAIADELEHPQHIRRRYTVGY